MTLDDWVKTWPLDCPEIIRQELRPSSAGSGSRELRLAYRTEY